MNHQNLTELVIKAQKGDKNAMNDLVGACYNDIYYYVLKTVKKEDLAADVTQESFLEIITTIGKLREPEAFPLWSRRIAYHKCALHFRNSKEGLVEEDEEGETLFDRLPDESEEALPEQVLEDAEFRKTIMDMINSLPSEQTNALLLYYYEKRSVQEIADIQETTAGTVKSRLNYARKAIRNKVEEYEKRTGTMLHGVGILPLLLRLTLESELSAMPVVSAPASLLASAAGSAGVAAAGTAAGTGAAAATTTAVAAKSVGTALAVKIVSGVVAASVAIGGTVYGVSKWTEKEDDASEIQESTSEPQYIEAGNQSVWSEPGSGVEYEPESSAPEESSVVDEPESSEPEESGIVDEPESSAPEESGIVDEPESTEPEESGIVDEPESSAPEESSVADEPESSEPPEEEPEVEGSVGLAFELNNDGTSYKVTGIGSCTDTEIVIPAKYNGLPVTEIKNRAFNGCAELTGVTISGGITAIGQAAFSGCTSLISIYIPKRVTKVESFSFDGCTSLTGITLPKSVVSVEYNTFQNCSNLITVSIPNSVTGIGQSAFSGCTSLTDIILPDGLLSIGDSAFNGCTSLTGVIIPDSVARIGQSAFRNCISITNIIIPDNVTKIEAASFNGCANLVNITLSGNATSVEATAFSGCTSLTDITLPDSVTTIGTQTFNGCTSLIGVTLPNSIITIGTQAFNGCTKLTDITYKGTTAEWDRINKSGTSGGWDRNTPDYTVHCIDGEIPKS